MWPLLWNWEDLQMNKWLIEMVVISTDKTYPIVICDTEEKSGRVD